MGAAVRADRLGVRFLFDRQRRVVTPMAARLRRRGCETWGVTDVSFSISPGEGVALIGPSGSGKTTLLRTLAGVLSPDTGCLEVSGRVASLLSTQAGLLSVLTGRENSLLLAVLAGLPRRRARVVMEDVKARSGLGDAFERPVSSLSQGMRARLGFAVAERVNPEILLIDEVHSFLDQEFRALLEQRARAILAAGGIVIAAGHENPMLERLCGRALLLVKGRLTADGAFGDVRRAYPGFAGESRGDR